MVPTNRVRGGTDNPLHLCTARPQKKPRQKDPPWGGAKFVASGMPTVLGTATQSYNTTVGARIADLHWRSRALGLRARAPRRGTRPNSRPWGINAILARTAGRLSGSIASRTALAAGRLSNAVAARTAYRAA